MPNFNSVTVMGNLTRDPELRYTKANIPVCEICIAVTRCAGESEKTSFFDITIYGKNATNCHRYLSKGSCAMFSGYLDQDVWEDRNTGKRRSAVKIVAESVQFISSPKTSSVSTSHHQYTKSQQPVRQGEYSAEDYPPTPQPILSEEVPCLASVDDDIPF